MTVKSLISDILGRVFNSINDSFDVSVQDQTTPMLDVLLSEKLETDITLTADASIGDETISVSAGHGFTAGSWIEIYENGRRYQAEVKSVSTNDITLALPIDFAYSTSATVYRVNVDLSVDGTTEKEFTFEALTTNSYDVYSAIVSMADGTAMDGGTFAGIAALTNGIYFAQESDTFTGVLLNMKRNQDLIERSCTHEFGDKAPSGEYSLFVTKQWGGGRGGNGVSVRVTPETNGKIKAVVRDNLTAVTSIRIALLGHIVD